MADFLEYVRTISELRMDDFENTVKEALEEKSKEERLTFLYDLKIYLKEIKKELIVYKNYSNDYEEKFYLKSRIKKLKKKVFLINRLIKENTPTKEKRTKVALLNSKQKKIRNDIYNEEDISKYSIKDQIVTLDYLIVEDFTLENYDLIVNYAHEISINLGIYLENNDIFKEFCIFLSDLKNRVTKSSKDSLERNNLKKICNDDKDVYKMYKKRKEEENEIISENSSYYDVIIYWLNSEENYNYIKALLERKKEAINTRYNGKHIVFYIIDTYIHNFKRMVNDKNSDYINLKYIEEVYYLFTKNPALKLSSEEKKIIDTKLLKFEEYIDNTLIKQKRKNYAKSICKNMKSNKFYKELTYSSYDEYDDDELAYYQISLTNGIKNMVQDKEYIDAYLYDDKVYNIKSKEDGKIVLSIYAIEFSDFIVRDSNIDKYLENCEIQNINVDPFFKKELVFQIDKKYPVINYELEFYPSGKFYGMKVKEDIIKVKNITEEKEIELKKLYKRSIVKNNDLESTLNSHFENVLQNAYISFVKEKSYPYIYYGKTVPNSVEINRNINDLSSDLFEMDKGDYAEIVNILSNEVDIYHYSLVPIKNAKYDLNLLNPVSFLGIENQRMLADIHFNRRKFTNKERLRSLKIVYMNKYFKKVCELNENLGYVDSNIIKLSRGKIKNRLKL